MCMQEYDEMEECTIRSLLRRYLSEYIGRVKREVINTARRLYVRLRYKYIMLFGSVRSKLLLNMETSLNVHAFAIAGILSQLIMDKNAVVDEEKLADMLNNVIKDAVGICILTNGEDIDLVVKCAGQKLDIFAERVVTILSPILLSDIFKRSMDALVDAIKTNGQDGDEI